MPKFTAMKKINLLFAMPFVLFMLTGCDFLNFKSTDPGISAPSVESTKDGFVISPTQVSNASYMSIIRYRVSDGSSSASKEDDTLYIVGQITPKQKKQSAYQFTDKYVRPGAYYQYYVRYKVPSGYVFSAATTTYRPQESSSLKEVAVTSHSPVKVFYDSTSTRLYLSADSEDLFITYTDSSGAQETPFSESVSSETSGNDFSLMVALTSSATKQTRLFPMQKSLVTDEFSIVLRDAIPETFYDIDLVVESFTRQETEITLIESTLEDRKELYADENVRGINYHWAIPCDECEVYSVSDEEMVNGNIIKVSSMGDETGTYDFTTPAANMRSATHGIEAEKESVSLDFSGGF